MIEVGDTYTSNKFGDYEVIEYNGWNKIRIRFKNTGYERLTCSSNINAGDVKDRYAKTVHGVGFLGDGKYSCGTHRELHSVWRSMIRRCYSTKCSNYNIYGARGVTVCDEWHNFQNFAKWYEDNYPKDGRKYDLDKDRLSVGIKVYSPETCCFLTHAENSIESNAKYYKMVSPDGEVIEIYNMSEFCRNNNLNQRAMSAVCRGKGNHHKGWTRV